MSTKVKNHFGASIVYTGRLFINNVNSRFNELGTNITFEQLEVLLHIAANPDKKIIQNDLAIITNKNKSGVLRTIDILETKHFARRTSVAGDRRKKVIEATAEGIATAKKAVDLFQKIEKEYMKKIKKEDIEVFTKVLDIIKNESTCHKTTI